jgi:hypothetical protein
MARESWKNGLPDEQVTRVTRNGNDKYQGPSFPPGGVRAIEFDITNTQVLKLLYTLGILPPYEPPELNYDENYWQ